MNKHRMPGVKALGLLAVMVTAIAGLWAGGVGTASAAACSDLVLPANATCNSGTVTFTDGGNTMALSVSSYANTQISVAVNTNHVATIGVGMTDQNNGDVVAIVPLAASSPAGVYFYKRTGGTDSLLGSVAAAGLPAVNQNATFIVNVYGSTVTVFVNGNQVATFSDPWLGSGKVGIGSNGAGYPTAAAQFWNILLGSTPLATGSSSVCYDQFGNVASCNCWNGTNFNNCVCSNVYGCNCANSLNFNCSCASFSNACSCWNGTAYVNCGNFANCNFNSFCNTCSWVYGTSVPCQCFNSFGSAVACGTSCNTSNGNWNGCGCDQNWNNSNWTWNNNNSNTWNWSWMNSNCHHLKTAADICDGIWAQNANGQWQEYCY